MRLLQTMMAMGPDNVRHIAQPLIGLVMDLDMPAGYDPVLITASLDAIEPHVAALESTNKDAYDSLVWVINTLRDSLKQD